MARINPMLLIGGAVAVWWFMSRPAGAPSAFAMQRAGERLPVTQEPALYWIDPNTNTVVYEPSMTPPAPGYRPASAWEITTYYAGGGLMGYTVN